MRQVSASLLFSGPSMTCLPKMWLWVKKRTFQNTRKPCSPKNCSYQGLLHYPSSEDWTLIAERINKRFNYKPSPGAFLPGRYLSYEDWFLRSLAPETQKECLAQAQLAEVCAPVQGKLWPQADPRSPTIKSCACWC